MLALADKKNVFEEIRNCDSQVTLFHLKVWGKMETPDQDVTHVKS